MSTITRRPIVEEDVIKGSFLIQRLTAPRGPIATPFTFGCGYANGGLSKEATQLLNGIFTFDYMGAAEYEFGGVPKALGTIAKYCSEKTGVKGSLKVRDSEVYFICNTPQREHVEALVSRLAISETGVEKRDYCGLSKTLSITERKPYMAVGWLELDNGFMFFADKEMFEKMCTVFGVN